MYSYKVKGTIGFIVTCRVHQICRFSLNLTEINDVEFYVVTGSRVEVLVTVGPPTT